ncbi:MAG: glycosyltransferase family 4 protein [Bacteroidetes bacterium]|nr:glycosyltransferase family 4 protein [Bacteroidota bacterium]MBT5530075.1 glycosyltransferase family 4 protein [Cytophagia bacterium]MBT3422828.1 glycosyltransferase family 4 protein [Bacteroidota bacterium]MBT3800412.1 glycosyltransferase family 4 protein [Bacteroidota bacterium]MBT3933334.1 glycosyltransferase family 4 protein [Bacteroidota bacterium]
MRIVVNTRFLIKNKLEGIGVFTAETFKRICKNNPDHEFIFLFDRAFDEEYIFAQNIKGIVLRPPARHPFLWFLWFEFSVHRFLKQAKADLFISCDGYVTLRTKTKTLAIIHDLAFEHYPKDVPWIARKYYRYFFPKFAWKADRIASVSEFSKNDICEWYSTDPNLIDVVYNGSSDHFNPISEDHKIEIRNRYTDGKEYFIYIGALHQRKNIVNLLKAFDRFRTKSDQDIKLLIVGTKAWRLAEMDQVFESMKYKSDVIFTGRLSDNDLAQTLASALALVYISYFEGFGIPLLEAMNCDVPIITSDRSSLPEVAGNAALIVDPFDLDDISEAMHKISTNSELRNSLIEKSKIQRQKFSWDKTAELMWESILKTI